MSADLIKTACVACECGGCLTHQVPLARAASEEKTATPLTKTAKLPPIDTNQVKDGLDNVYKLLAGHSYTNEAVVLKFEEVFGDQIKIEVKGNKPETNSLSAYLLGAYVTDRSDRQGNSRQTIYVKLAPGFGQACYKLDPDSTPAKDWQEFVHRFLNFYTHEQTHVNQFNSLYKDTESLSRSDRGKILDNLTPDRYQQKEPLAYFGNKLEITAFARGAYQDFINYGWSDGDISDGLRTAIIQRHDMARISKHFKAYWDLRKRFPKEGGKIYRNFLEQIAKFIPTENIRPVSSEEMKLFDELSKPKAASFDSWFAGSKVVDNAGNPLRCYHGTKSSIDFDEFSVDGPVIDDDDPDGNAHSSGSGADVTAYLGAHFAQETSVANQFAQGIGWQKTRYDGDEEKPRVIPVFLSIKNPKDFGPEKNLRDYIYQGEIRDDQLTEMAMQADGIEYDDDEAVDEWNKRYAIDADFRAEQNDWIFRNTPQDEMLNDAAHELASEARSRLQREGHDGIRYKNEVEGGISWIVFSPNQVKSAIGNSGNFDPKNKSITAAPKKTPADQTPAFRSWFSGSKVVDSKGNPLKVFHGTDQTFDVFDTERGELGSHFGTTGQAESFGSNVKPCYLKIKNPLRLRDYGAFDVNFVAPQLADLGIIDAETMDTLLEMEDQAKAERKMKAAIMKAGYDGVVYVNRREGYSGSNEYDDMEDDELLNSGSGAADSWIAFKPNQIRPAVASSITAAAKKRAPAKTRITDTPAFKSWFGDSKIVDRKGNPMVVFHGTQKDFDTFDLSSRDGSLFYFTVDPDLAAEYAGYYAAEDDEGAGPNIRPCYLRVSKPFDPRKPDHWRLIKDEVNFNRGDRGFYLVYEDEDVIDAIRSHGFDGIWMKENEGAGHPYDTIAVFNSKQIKSAIGNSGDFDPEKSSITASAFNAREHLNKLNDKHTNKVLSRNCSAKTAGLKEWFGDSKIVDKNGNPLPVYHATKDSFEEFTIKPSTRSILFKEYEVHCPFHFFTPDESWAKEFGGPNSKVLTVYLKMERPLDMTTRAGLKKAAFIFGVSAIPSEELVNEHQAELDEAEKDLQRALARVPKPFTRFVQLDPATGEVISSGTKEKPGDVRQDFTLEQAREMHEAEITELQEVVYGARLALEKAKSLNFEISTWMALDEPDAADKLKAAGYDGVIFEEDDGSIAYAVPDANQIKSVNAKDFDAGSNKITAAADNAMSLADINAIVREYMPLLTPGLPLPNVKVVNNQGSSWLGRDVWRAASPDNTLIELQKSITYDEQKARRIIAHELCHHDVVLTVARHMNPATRKYMYDGHGKEWQAMAAKFNARFGADFVTKTSDQNMVIADTGKEYYLRVWDRGGTGRNDGSLWFSWCVRPSPKQQKYINEKIERDGFNYRLFKITDPVFSSKGCKVGEGWSGLRLGKDDSAIEKLQKIWDEQVPQPMFRVPKAYEDKLRERQELLDKWTQYEKSKANPPAKDTEPEMTDDELLNALFDDKPKKSHWLLQPKKALNLSQKAKDYLDISGDTIVEEATIGDYELFVTHTGMIPGMYQIGMQRVGRDALDPEQQMEKTPSGMGRGSLREMAKVITQWLQKYEYLVIASHDDRKTALYTKFAQTLGFQVNHFDFMGMQIPYISGQGKRASVRLVHPLLLKKALNVPNILKTFGPKMEARYKAEGGPDTTADKLVDELVSLDKSPTKEYVFWLASNYAKGGINRWEDIASRAIPNLERFDSLKKSKKIPVEQRDIMKLKGLPALESLVDEHTEVDTTSNRKSTDKQEKDFFDSGEAILVYNDADIKVVIPKTEKASCYFGVNTKWCTAAREDNAFEHYAEQGDLYIVLFKSENRRYQFFFGNPSGRHGEGEPGFFADERDHEINTKKLADEWPILYDIFTPIANEYLSLEFNNNPSVDTVEHFAESLDWNNDARDILLSPEMQMVAVKQNPWVLGRLINPTIDAEFEAITSEPDILNDYRTSYELDNMLVEHNSSLILSIHDPSDDTTILAVQDDPSLLEHMRDISHAVQMAAVEESGMAIEYIRHPDDDVIMAAVTQNGRAIQFIKNPDEDVQMAAVKSDPPAIQYIDDPTEEAQLEAVQYDGEFIRFIDNPSEEVQMAAVQNASSAIKFIKNPSEEVRLMAKQKWDKTASKVSYMAPRTGELTIVVQHSMPQRVTITLDMGIPRFTRFSITFPTNDVPPEEVDGCSKQAFDALLDDLTTFLLSMNYQESEIVGVIRLAAECFANVNAAHATDAKMKVQDSSIRMYQSRFELPESFIQETHARIMTAALVKRVPVVRQLNLVPLKEPENHPGRVIELIRDQSTHSTPLPFEVKVEEKLLAPPLLKAKDWRARLLRKPVTAMGKVALNVPNIVKIFGPKLESRYKAENPNEDKTAQQLVDTLVSLDKSPTKEYVFWLAANYAKGGINRWEDITSRAIPALERFDSLKKSKKIPVEQRDIMKLKGLPALESLVDEHAEVDTTSNRQSTDQEEKAFFANGEAELIYNDAQVKVVVPKTEEASCYFGVNTQWCTAARNDNRFSQYNAEGPLYIVLIKAKNQRYQFHFEGNQFMDEQDQRINPYKLAEEYPVLWKIFSPISEKAGSVVFNSSPSEAVQLAAVKQNGEFIRYIKNPSEAVQLTAVRQDGAAIQFLKSPSEAVQLSAVNRDGWVIRYIKNPSEEAQLKAVEQDGAVIRYIKNPSEQAQLKAVSRDGRVIQFIKNPSEEAQIKALEQDGAVIRYIKNPSEEAQLTAVNQNGRAIQYIKNPSEAVQRTAVKQNGRAIQFIKNPSEAVQLAALEQDAGAIQFIKSPSEAVQRAAVEQDGGVVFFIKNPSEAVQLAAVKQNWRAIQYIKNPSEGAQIRAVEQDGGMIRYIKNPSEEAQRAAVNRDWWVIQYIKKPSEAVQLSAVKQNKDAIKFIKNPSKAVQMAAAMGRSASRNV